MTLSTLDLPWWAGTTEEFMNIGGPFDDRDEAIAADREHQGGDQFWILQARQAAWSPPCAASVIDDMCNNADELFYEDGFDGFNGPKADEKAAEDDLQIVLNEWFARHLHIFPQPTTFACSTAVELIDPEPDEPLPDDSASAAQDVA